MMCLNWAEYAHKKKEKKAGQESVVRHKATDAFP